MAHLTRHQIISFSTKWVLIAKRYLFWWFPAVLTWTGNHGTKRLSLSYRNWVYSTLAPRGWTCLPSCCSNHLVRLSLSLQLFSLQGACRALWRNCLWCARPWRGKSHRYWTGAINSIRATQLGGIKWRYVYLPSPRVTILQQSVIDIELNLHDRIDGVEEDFVTACDEISPPLSSMSEQTLANWEMLGNEEYKKIMLEGGPLKREVRYSLTCRDVQHVARGRSILGPWISSFSGASSFFIGISEYLLWMIQAVNIGKLDI